MASPMARFTIGSSPLTRGKRDVARNLLAMWRLIPAHAGKTVAMTATRGCVAAHPRSRGENWILCRRTSYWRGSSPLTRGKLSRAASSPPAAGLIPAHAGKTFAWKLSTDGTWAHPRSRGENIPLVYTVLMMKGSSPLTRGKPLRRRTLRSWLRLIPAHAGKTYAALVEGSGGPAHPRSRGENLSAPVT